jgi:hypothetical protein
MASVMMAVVGHASLDVLHGPGSPAEREKVLTAFMAGMHRAYLVAAAICFFGMWTSMDRGKAGSQNSQNPGENSAARPQ